MTWDEALTKLNSFRTLRDDWDGDGSVAPTASIIQRAIDYASGQGAALAPDRVIVGVNGTIYFEWFAPYVEVEVTEHGIGWRVGNE